MTTDPYASPIVCSGRGLGDNYLKRITPNWKQPERMGPEAQMTYDYLIDTPAIRRKRTLTCPRCGTQFVEGDPQAHQVHCIPCQDARAEEADERKHRLDIERQARNKARKTCTKA
jgi:hypothetical protein